MIISEKELSSHYHIVATFNSQFNFILSSYASYIFYGNTKLNHRGHSFGVEELDKYSVQVNVIPLK